MPSKSEMASMPTPQLIMWFVKLCKPTDHSEEFRVDQVKRFKIAWEEIELRIPARGPLLTPETETPPSEDSGVSVVTTGLSPIGRSVI